MTRVISMVVCRSSTKPSHFHLSKAISLNPAGAFAYNNRGSTKLTKGDVDGALADITKSISLDSENAEAYCNLGLARLTQNKVAEAKQSSDKCYGLDENLRARFEKLARQVKRKAD
jgi:tetratricopeptide (TPR) repeat protein